MNQQQRQHVWLPLALGICAMLLGGCAGFRCPRIDPSGEHLFICPKDQVQPVSPTAGNLVAPPVYTDAVFPQPAVAPAAGIAPQVGGVIPPVPQDRMRITPNKILAPVGSEVVLKAGVCTAENHLLTCTKTDWLIARDTAGEFVELGGRGWCRDPWLPWNKPEKIDNQYAIGYSAKVPLTITRGTADPSDDVVVEEGEAWATITSPVEGTSHITAVAPEIVDWNGRRATATIYWVDVQWTFPATNVTSGGQQVLTTTVRRQTDGTPLEGWIVKYQVSDGTGALANSQSGQVVEVPTDANGRASIDVTPTGSGTVTQINTQLIRPASFAGSDMPRLEIANGTTTINWNDSGTPYLPPVDDIGSRPTPAPTLTEPPAPPITAQQPELDLEIRGPSDAQMNGQVRLEVIIHNRGNGMANGVVLSDRFDEGFSHIADPNRYLKIEKTVSSIAPGSSHTEYLTFNVLRAGNICHDFTANCREGSSSQKRACINVTQPLPQKRPGMEVRKDGPELKEVGQTALFTLTVRNTGEVPLTNVEIVDEYDQALSPQPTRQGYQKIGNRIIWQIPRIEVGQTERFDINCQCLAPKEQACSTAQVSANTGSGVLPSADDHCIHIVPSRDVVPPDGNNVLPPSGGGVFPPSQGAAAGLQLDIFSLSTNVLRVGTIAKYEVVVANNSPSNDDQVQLSIQFPSGLVPELNSIRNNANVTANLNGNVLVFQTIQSIRPQERFTFNFQASVNQQSVGNIIAQVISRRQPQALQKTIPFEAIR